MRSQIVAYFSEIKKINYRRGMIIDNYDYDNPANCSTETCKLPIFYFFYQFVFEGMEESGSEGLDKLIYDKKDTFFKV